MTKTARSALPQSMANAQPVPPVALLRWWQTCPLQLLLQRKEHSYCLTGKAASQTIFQRV
ncbi:MAG: hypothetical protein EBQ71_10220 [Betaproteobacteria bacterium]|nr:hypothetical protein [Betaproteobacteria bacterium]